MKTTTKKTKHPIPWFRRRWVWGVVLVIIAIITVKFYQGIVPICSNYNFIDKAKTTLTIFSAGFIVGLPIFIFFLPNLSESLFMKLADFHFKFNKTTSGLIILIYYATVIWLIYKTFKQKSVQLKYPIILISILTPSFAGAFALAFGSNC